MNPLEARRREEAIAWFAALRAGVMLAADRAAYDAWRADPENQAALDAVHEMWGELAVLRDLKSAPQPRRRPWSAIAAAGAALALFSGLGIGWLVLSAGVVIETSIGQQKVQSLPDGSLVALNVASRVSYTMGEDSRRVNISDGEVAFTVKADPDRPFIVRTGDYDVRAIGTMFNVRQRDGDIEISVSEGRVEICAATGPNAGDVLASLSAGKVLRLPITWPAGAFEPSPPEAVPPDQVAEWRAHVVTYEDASVREVVEDLNRYFERKMLVERASLQEKRVTVRLQVEDRDHALGTLANLLNVRIRKTAEGDVLE